MHSFFNRLLGKLETSLGAALVLAAVIVCVFSPCLSAGFLNWDDPAHLLNSPFLPLIIAINIYTNFEIRKSGSPPFIGLGLMLAPN